MAGDSIHKAVEHPDSQLSGSTFAPLLDAAVESELGYRNLTCPTTRTTLTCSSDKQDNLILEIKFLAKQAKDGSSVYGIVVPVESQLEGQEVMEVLSNAYARASGNMDHEAGQYIDGWQTGKLNGYLEPRESGSSMTMSEAGLVGELLLTVSLHYGRGESRTARNLLEGLLDSQMLQVQVLREETET